MLLILLLSTQDTVQLLRPIPYPDNAFRHLDDLQHMSHKKWFGALRQEIDCYKIC